MNDNNGMEIAIIAMTGRFPGANNLDQFWQNLSSGIESITFFTDEELAESGVDFSLLKNPNYVKAAGILEDIDAFDASFFGFNPREAEITDPQHRLFLECAWEALEAAGYNPENYPGAIGVYAGASMSGYYLVNLAHNPDINATIDIYQLSLANDKDFLTTRVSYKLNLEGPSVDVQTACSTSLTAVHLACQSLWSGECDIALAGGVSITLPQKVGYLYHEGSILSPDGHCRAFDSHAQGTVNGNGIGLVVLKRLEEAIADGDTIHAVIKGSAINNDGSLKVSYTAPRIDGQAKVIQSAQLVAEVEPETITYIEAHGTATPLGDPIEIAALTQAFRAKTDKTGFCAIGSLKTNIGHLDTAAGVAGLIKTVLALKHRQIPPSLHFQQPNPQINFEQSPFYVNSTLTDWKSDCPRRAGVSSFGIGGTNVHLILEEAPELENSGHSRPWQLLLLSARSQEALDRTTANLAQHLQHHPELNLADVAYTLQVGRKDFTHRRMLLCQDSEDAVKTLQSRDPQRVITQVIDCDRRSLAFMFPGQGSQYFNMGRELYQSDSLFAQEVDRCCDLLKPHLKLDLRDILFFIDEPTKIDQTFLAQPALFVIEYALAQLWMSWGIEPDALIGHSIGEYVAATLAGVFSLEDALKIVAYRGQLMQQCPLGSMLTVSLPETEVYLLLSDRLSLAAVNSPSLCVVSGETEAILELQDQLNRRGVKCRRLHTSHGYHSQMMEEILEPFTQFLQEINLQAPIIPFISNLTGTWITPSQATDSQYWARHLRSSVRFADGITQLLEDKERILLEVGPGQTLTSLTKQNPLARERLVLTSLPHPQDSQCDLVILLNTLGCLWMAGVSVNWSGFYGSEHRYRLPLPTYPFERQRYWIEPQNPLNPTSLRDVGKKPNLADWFYVPSWKRSSLLTSLCQVFVTNFNDNQLRLCWLVFVDSRGLGQSIFSQLKQAGQDAIAVEIGATFSADGDIYRINPNTRSDYELLLEKLQQQAIKPQKILHLWGLTEELEKDCFSSLLFLAQAWGEKYNDEPLDIGVVSYQMQDVIGEGLRSPHQATVLGPVRVIPQEYSSIACRSIDIILPKLPSQVKHLGQQLISEMLAPFENPVVAYRGRYRWIQTFEPISLGENQPKSSQLRQGGVYLITGGLGGIGLSLAQYLAQTVQAKLILVSRSPLSDQDSNSPKIQAIQHLLDCGAQVLVKSANVADFEQMQTVVEEAIAVFGEINGIIHAAGIPGGGTIPFKTPEAVNKILEAKVKGTLVLDALFKNKSLDFLVLCSSLNAVLGGFGQVDYCAANAFMDAFALSYKAQKGFAVSINWDTWQEVGMAVNANLPKQWQQQQAESLKNGILPQEGVEVFRRILESGLPQILVSTQDLASSIQKANSVKVLAEKITEIKTHHDRPNLGHDYIAPRNSLEQKIADIWQELLGIKQIGIYDNFFELGGHSLLATQVMSRLKEALQVELSLRSLFDSPTVAQLAESLNLKEINPEKSPDLPIQPRSRDKQIPLSFAQQRLWLIEQLEPATVTYNSLDTVYLKGDLDQNALEQSLNEIVKRHEVLRTTFTQVEGQPIQVILPPHAFALTVLDLRMLDDDEQKQEIERLIAQETLQPFDLEKGPLMRIKLLRLKDEEHILILGMHHIIFDDWSVSLLTQEIAVLYTALSAGKPSPLQDLPIQYADFALWQRQRLQQEDFVKQLTYWKQQLSGHLPILELPSDRPRSPIQTFRGTTLFGLIPSNLVTDLKRLCQQEGVTLFMALLATFKTLLYRYTGQEDILVGSPIANRNRAEIESLIGFFANTLVLRTDLSNNPTFKELLARVRETTLGAYAHQDFPFEQLVQELQPERHLSHSPLFQVMFVLHNTPLAELELPGLKLTHLEIESKTAKFDLTLNSVETPEGLKIFCEYNTDLFEEATIARLLGHFQTLLTGIIANPNQSISTLPLLTPDEQEQVLRRGNNSPQNYAQFCIHELFERQVKLTPNAVAIVFEGQKLTYQDLNNRANQLAHYLQKLGIKPDTLVGICLERSLSLIIAILGVLKAGGAYVPLDPMYPDERLAFMIEDAQLSLIVSEEILLDKLPSLQAKVICLEGEFLTKETQDNPITEVTPNNLAYVIYTSGSTGLPKGVLVNHSNVVRLFAATEDWYHFNSEDVWTLFHSAAFDFSVWEIWGALLYGGRLVIVPYLISRSPDAFYELLCQKKVTVLNQTPSAFRQLINVEELRKTHDELSLRFVIFGGEALDIQSLKPWFKRHGDVSPQLVNMYGITETTVHVTYRPITIADLNHTASAIGCPIPDLQVYLLDKYQQPVPIGVPGEIYVGGAGVTRGYLNRPELNRERFIPNPFSDRGRLYKAGDLARYLPNGELDYLGRIDHQVKIRGFRIELGEIEAVLGEYPAVKQAVVLARENQSGEKQLIAYLVAETEANEPLKAENLRGYLKDKLPDYMIPAAFVGLEALPMTHNGKIDRKALAKLEITRPELDSTFVEPRTPIEKRIAEIWAEVLEIEKVGIYDNFFELGGHSLVATRVIYRLKDAFKIEMSLSWLFESPTIAQLGEKIEKAIAINPNLDVVPLLKASREEALPLSYAQQRMWVLNQLVQDSSVYNLVAAARLQGSLNLEVLEQSLNTIVKRHEILRTSFEEVEGQLIQVILPELILSIPIIDLSSYPPSERETQAKRKGSEQGNQAFDFSKPPLLRVTLLRLDTDDHIVVLTMHHIISDGWSIGVFLQELGTHYRDFCSGKPSSLAALSFQYADYAIWQRQWLQGEVLEHQLDYWRQQLRGSCPRLSLSPNSRLSVSSNRGAGLSFTLPQDLMTGVSQLSHQEGVTLFMTLLAAYQSLLFCYSGQEDIRIGSPIANRPQVELEQLIGFFINTLVLRADFSDNPSFEELLGRTRQVTLSAYTHQDLPFEKLVEDLQPERTVGHQSLYQAWFVLQNAPMPSLELLDVTMSLFELETDTVRHDLLLSIWENSDSFRAIFEYKSDLFDRAIITRLAKSFETLLGYVVNNPKIKLSELANLIKQADRELKLLQEEKLQASNLQKLKTIKRKNSQGKN